MNSNTSASNPHAVGQKVELNDGRRGIVRFIGTASFSEGQWVGIELEEPTGKNDGVVQGKRYFQCPNLHGLFCRSSGINRTIEESRPASKVGAKQPTSKAASNGAPVKARPSSINSNLPGTRRQTLTHDGPSKRASAVGSPTPAPRLASGIRSPIKSPTKQVGATGSSSTSTSRTGTPPVIGAKKPATSTTAVAKPRTSIATSAAAPGRRTSTLPSAPGVAPRTAKAPSAAATARTTAARTSAAHSLAPTRAAASGRLSSTTEESTDVEGSEIASTRESADSESAASQPQTEDEDEEDEVDDTIRPIFAPPPVPPNTSNSNDRTTRARRPSSPTAASIQSRGTIRSTAQTNSHVAALEAKINMLERKNAEGRDLRNQLEKAHEERDSARKIIEKVNTKYKPLQQEIDQLRTKVASYETQFKSVEDLEAQHEIDMENALLDREMAEETVETLRTDLAMVRARKDELELELEIMTEENSELSKGMSAEDRNSAGWLQLQKSNERLKEALLSLRDMTQDKEAELHERIAALEDQVKELDSLRSQLGETTEKLLRTEADAEDLRQQLEVAANAEDMIEKLGDENMSLKDRIDELKGVIEDLEDLKEVNDELEINHVETEKQLQEEIDFNESLLFDRERALKEQQAALDVANQNINRFRALVTQMQTDLQDLEASKQISETEAADLSSKSRAMLDLNQKLQSSAAKTQVKTIDLELRKMDADQAAEHLGIVQLFLPETYLAERDSVLALLRFKRIGFKANLLHTFLKERIGTFGARGQVEEVFAGCDALGKLTRISGMANRLESSIASCSPDKFAQYGGALYELEVVERTLDGYIIALRQDELKESDMTVRLGRSVEVMAHLAGEQIGNSLADHSDDLAARSGQLHSYLDTTASALVVVGGLIENNLPKASADAEYEDESVTDAALILNRVKTIVESARSAKVVSSKTARALSELKDRSLTLEPSFLDKFENAEKVASEITKFACQSGAALQQLFGEEGRADSFSLGEVSNILSSAATDVFSLPSPEAGPYAALNNRMRDLGSILADLSGLPTDLDNTVEFEKAPAPWLARAKELKHAKEVNVDMKEELARAQEGVRERDVLVRQKEVELNEQTIRIEMLEARMKEAAKRSQKIGELERELREARSSESRAKTELLRAQQDAQVDVERVREEVTRLHEERKKSSVGNKSIDGDAMGFNTQMVIERHEHTIGGLKGAVRHLKRENHQLRLPTIEAHRKNSHDWIGAPMTRPKRYHDMDGEKALEAMMRMATKPPTIDLTKTPENKLAWRPAKQTPRWQIEGIKGNWAEFDHWRQSLSKGSTREVSNRFGYIPLVA